MPSECPDVTAPADWDLSAAGAGSL